MELLKTLSEQFIISEMRQRNEGEECTDRSGTENKNTNRKEKNAHTFFRYITSHL